MDKKRIFGAHMLLTEMFVKNYLFACVLASRCFWWSRDHSALSSLACFPMYHVIFLSILSHFSLYFWHSVISLWWASPYFFIFNLLGVLWAFNICKFTYFTKFGKLGVIISPNTSLPHSFSPELQSNIYTPLATIYIRLTEVLAFFFCFHSFFFFLSDFQIE